MTIPTYLQGSDGILRVMCSEQCLVHKQYVLKKESLF